MFIAFEGCAGTGKTTQAEILADYLISNGRRISLSYVYEGYSRKLVSEFMSKSGIKKDQIAIMFLFQALQVNQYREVNEALKSGNLVIADRWRQSFFAYHEYADTFKGDKELMSKLDNMANKDLEPDVCFILNVPTEVSYERYKKRELKTADGGLGLVDMEYFVHTQAHYLQVAKEKKWHIIDGVGSPLVVFERIRNVIDSVLK